MTFPQAVLDAIDAGHVGAGLTNAGLPGEKSACKLDREPWPCASVVEARELDRRARAAARQ